MTTPTTRWTTLCSLTLAGIAGLGAEEPAAAPDLWSALKGGSVSLDARYRYEFADVEGFDENAHASTLRVRLGYRTAPFLDVTGFLEFEGTRVVGNKLYTDPTDPVPGRPVVADPESVEFNRYWLRYEGFEDLGLTLGRQRIIHDGARFVGNVGWRQNEQTYDSLSVRYDGWEQTTVFYSYVANVARIFGSAVPAGNHEQNTHLLNVRVDLDPNVRVVGYAYLIDNDDAPAFSTNTFGLRAEGGVDVGGGRLDLLGEVATQSDAGNAPASFDADYYRAQATWKAGAWSVAGGIESLGSDDGQAFRTPLATLHAFNGWADLFLTTPADGLDDLYLRAGLDLGGWQLDLRLHDFSAETGGADYGSELDLAAKRGLGERYDLLLQVATFDADDPSFSDTTKAWLMLTARF